MDITNLDKDTSDVVFKEETVRILMDTAKSEYDHEHNRTSIIDSKTNISLPIISAFLIAIIPLNDYKFIFSLPTTTFYEWIIPALLFVTYTSTVVLSFISMLSMVKVISTREYKVLKISDLYDEDLLSNDPINMYVTLIDRYDFARQHNSVQNSIRIKWYKLGWILSIISVLTYLVYLIIKNNM